MQSPTPPAVTLAEGRMAAERRLAVARRVSRRESIDDELTGGRAGVLEA